MILYTNFENNCFLLVIFVLKWRIFAYFKKTKKFELFLTQPNVYYIFKKLKY